MAYWKESRISHPKHSSSRKSPAAHQIRWGARYDSGYIFKDGTSESFEDEEARSFNEFFRALPPKSGQDAFVKKTGAVRILFTPEEMTADVYSRPTRDQMDTIKHIFERKNPPLFIWSFTEETALTIVEGQGSYWDFERAVQKHWG